MLSPMKDSFTWHVSEFVFCKKKKDTLNSLGFDLITFN